MSDKLTSRIYVRVAPALLKEVREYLVRNNITLSQLIVTLLKNLLRHDKEARERAKEGFFDGVP